MILRPLEAFYKSSSCLEKHSKYLLSTLRSILEQFLKPLRILFRACKGLGKHFEVVQRELQMPVEEF